MKALPATLLPFLSLGLALGAASCSSSGQNAAGDGGPSTAGDDGSVAEGGDDSGGAGSDSGGGNGSDSGTGGKGDGGKGGDGGGKEGGAGVTSCDGGGGPGTTSAAAWFAPSMYFNQAVDSAQLDPQSATVISTLVKNGGWGTGALQVDTSIDVYYADCSAKRLPFVAAANLTMPDSDIPASVPVDPSTMASSKAPGFESDTACSDDGDCHYLVMDPANHQLIEVFGASTDGTTFTTLTDGRGIFIWDWTKAYPGNLRGDVCTSADASGGLMAPLLFTADEIAAGHIDHAIRFILPNSRIQNKEYVRPATHGTGAASWAMSNGVPYGARLRLHASYDASALTAGAKVVVAALKKYGMILSDGGNIAFTAKSDQYTTAKWANELGSHDLAALAPTDFDMVEASYGTDAESSSKRYDFTSYDCARNP